MLATLRRIGIAMGSLVIAYLAVALVAGTLLGASAESNPIVIGLIVILGGLIYAEILRRERRKSAVAASPDPLGNDISG